MDLFGMYGSRDDTEHEQEQTEDQSAATPAAAEPRWATGADDDQDTAPLAVIGPDYSPPAPDPVAEPQWEQQPRSARDEQVARYVSEIGLVDARRRLVRPYATTGGRTYAGTDLALETMIASTSRGHGAVKLEHRQVVGVCAQPASVAEIAAHTELPIGAARVVIADMIELNLVIICSTQPAGDAPSTSLMSRVLEGLRRL